MAWVMSCGRARTTVRGNALAQASFSRPIGDATAERHLTQVVERAAAYNADPGYLLTVKEIAVFGSYLDAGPGASARAAMRLVPIPIRRS